MLLLKTIFLAWEMVRRASKSDLNCSRKVNIGEIKVNALFGVTCEYAYN
jgi:hypothetical protein